MLGGGRSYSVCAGSNADGANTMNARCIAMFKVAGLLLMLSALLAAGCEGGLHRKGERRLGVAGSYGEPIKGDVIWPEGDGRASNAGVTVSYDHYVADRTSIRVAATPYRVYHQSDGDVYAGEFELGARYHFWEFHLADVPFGLYGEVLGGLAGGGRSIPEDGSHLNFTQGTGLGMEVQLTDDISWTSGYRLRHLSNGRIFGDENPSQNDHFVYTGLSFRLGP